MVFQLLLLSIFALFLTPGFIKYLSSLGLLKENELITEKEYFKLEEKRQIYARNLTDSDLINKFDKLEKIPQKNEVKITKYTRNPYVSEYVRRKAKGICQDCLNPAPFVSKNTGEPFLEIHHIIQLAHGGEDTIENTIALCPNCHRKRHYG